MTKSNFKKNIIAIIPARSGSKGIKDKNLSLLEGYPLIAYSIILAKLIPEINQVIVSTDSELYAGVAKKFGAEVPFLRPSSFAEDSSSDYDFMSHAVDWYEKNDCLPEYWIHLRPTTPLRESSIVKKAIELILSNQEATSLRSCHLSPESPFKWLRKNSEGYFTNLLGNDSNLDKYNGPRQEYPDVFIPNGYVDIVKSSFIKKNKLLHGDKVIAFETPLSFEVDSKDELEMINLYLKKNGSPLLKKLKS
jgi:N-acylneuraminate cytidylyltransferase